MTQLKSLMALSMHKAGSSIADNIILDFCTAKGYEIDRISKQTMGSPKPEASIYQDYQNRMRTEGVYYGIARGPYVENMAIIQKLKTIIQVRDPRDCITSAYFSFSKSHVPPTDPDKLRKFEETRKRIAQLSIDQYARDMASDYRQRLQILSDIMADHDDILMLRYEDMVEDTQSWLGQISDFLEQPLSDDLMAVFGHKIDFTVQTEDENRHKRQVTPGDHRRKLHPETIHHLNKVLGAQMARFGYTC